MHDGRGTVTLTLKIDKVDCRGCCTYVGKWLLVPGRLTLERRRHRSMTPDPSSLPCLSVALRTMARQDSPRFTNRSSFLAVSYMNGVLVRSLVSTDAQIQCAIFE